MKKVLCIVLGISIIFTFFGCSNNNVYTPREDCCIVSIPKGFELWSSDAEYFYMVKDNLSIKNITRDDNKNYYAITKNASFSIINFELYINDENTKGQGKVVTGFKVGNMVVPFTPTSPEDLTLLCDKNTDIVPVYDEYMVVGIAVFISNNDDMLDSLYYEIENCFDVDGNVIERDGFYYLIRYDDMPKPYFKTNMECTEVSFTSSSATYMSKKYTLSEGQELNFCLLSRYGGTKYFLNTQIYRGGNPQSLMKMTIDIGKDYKLTLQYE